MAKAKISTQRNQRRNDDFDLIRKTLCGTKCKKAASRHRPKPTTERPKEFLNKEFHLFTSRQRR
jgi:hypothetical protein